MQATRNRSLASAVATRERGREKTATVSRPSASTKAVHTVLLFTHSTNEPCTWRNPMSGRDVCLGMDITGHHPKVS